MPVTLTLSSSCLATHIQKDHMAHDGTEEDRVPSFWYTWAKEILNKKTRSTEKERTGHKKMTGYSFLSLSLSLSLSLFSFLVFDSVKTSS
jgi:hypothetical protein